MSTTLVVPVYILGGASLVEKGLKFLVLPEIVFETYFSDSVLKATWSVFIFEDPALSKIIMFAAMLWPAVKS